MIRTLFLFLLFVASAAQSQRATSEQPRRARVSQHAELPTAHPAASLSSCLSALRGERKVRSSTPVLATMNVRWFPDGRPGRRAPVDGAQTNIEWLACLMAHTGADAIALQEIKTLPRARKAMNQVLRLLDKHTAGQWQVAYDNCPGEADLHVAIIWDTTRAQRSGAIRTLAALNPHREACKHQLRPGVLVPLRLSDGTIVRFISVHFKSGVKRRSYDLREQSYAALEEVVRDVRGHLVIAGDFNTMGCKKCSPPISAESDRASLTRYAKAAGMRLIEPTPRCSYVYRGRPSLLDGFVVERSLLRKRTPKAYPMGHCGAQACGEGRVRHLDVVREVTDHCPLVLQL